MKVSKEPKENLSDLLYLTFFAAFLFLSGTTLITLMGSFSFNEKNQSYVKHALISETAVNIIASVTYYYFIKYLYAEKLNIENVTSIRYLDWAFTTPLLLVSFVLFACYTHDPGKPPEKGWLPLLYIILLDLGMLFLGYMGETRKWNFYFSFFISFACYSGIMYFLYISYIDPNEDGDFKSGNYGLFIIFALIWGCYGLCYLLPTREKNIGYNILDLISKAGFGVFIWLTVVLDSDSARQEVSTT